MRRRILHATRSSSGLDREGPGATFKHSHVWECRGGVLKVGGVLGVVLGVVVVGSVVVVRTPRAVGEVRLTPPPSQGHRCKNGRGRSTSWGATRHRTTSCDSFNAALGHNLAQLDVVDILLFLRRALSLPLSGAFEASAKLCKWCWSTINLVARGVQGRNVRPTHVDSHLQRAFCGAGKSCVRDSINTLCASPHAIDIGGGTKQLSIHLPGAKLVADQDQGPVLAYSP